MYDLKSSPGIYKLACFREVKQSKVKSKPFSAASTVAIATLPHIKKAFNYLPTTGRSFDFIILSLSDNRERGKVIVPCSFYLNGFPVKRISSVTKNSYNNLVQDTHKYYSKVRLKTSI